MVDKVIGLMSEDMLCCFADICGVIIKVGQIQKNVRKEAKNILNEKLCARWTLDY